MPNATLTTSIEIQIEPDLYETIKHAADVLVPFTFKEFLIYRNQSFHCHQYSSQLKADIVRIAKIH